MIWDDLRTLLKYAKMLQVRLDEIESDLDALNNTCVDLRTAVMLQGEAASERFDVLVQKLSTIEQALIPSEAAHFVFLSISDGVILEVSQMQMSVEKVCQLKIAPVDKFGNPAKVDGAPAWSLTDPALGSLAVDADGMGAVFTPAGTVGALSVQVNADADLGDGVKTIAGELPLELLAGEAIAVNVSGLVV